MDYDIFNKKPIHYIFFFTILMLIARSIFMDNTIEWLLGAVRPIVIVLIIIYLLEPLTIFYQSRFRLKRTTSVVTTFLTALFVVLLFIGIILPSTIKSMTSIIQQLPESSKKITSFLTAIPIIKNFIDENTLLEVFNDFNQFFSLLTNNILSYSSRIIQSFKGVITSIVVFILAILMSFYALRDYEKIWGKIELSLRSIIGDQQIKPYIRIIKLTDSAFKKFFIGKLITCVFLGFLVLIFGVIFNLISPVNIPYLPLIAIIIGITNIIPYVGPFFGAIPSLVFALINGFLPAIGLLAIVLVAQQIDNIIITPKIIGESVGLKPFWVILSVTVGGKLFGVLGMLLVVPITSVILILLDERIKKYKEA